ncbi:hypothetical protein LJ655_01555 [Paraburkholderia sp. MMS20-SJTN17]|uniref:Uncharacterized protein n=1 Tax=Paraburkholderia translucens TaxID=2886945 RepID=A0ABS8K780_9BURK|nr:hypothetical protein [Paraburkholderia sp. MMS20-SJTN17]MCC8400590.1 hypothetical protein [Paraburkholderia sp. MMS20-SJTN17]
MILGHDATLLFGDGVALVYIGGNGLFAGFMLAGASNGRTRSSRAAMTDVRCRSG